ncbi:serine hydrolase [Rhodobacterales bacterium HKCCE3408]|nr:serine hydrolase [Rhodobacterales bacterium HKCCE3408]
MRITRRGLMAGTAAVLAAPALAQEQGFREMATSHADRLHSLVIRQGGAEVFAESYGGRGLDAPANVKSVSKTLVALLTGIAIGRGDLPGTEAKVLPLLGRAPAGDARDDLTIDHLLSMRAGLESTSGANYGAWVTSRDWVETALAQEMVARPGGRFIYSTGGWHVLGAVLARATGESLLTLARDWLGAPMEIEFAPWVRDRQGRYLGGNDMALSPRGLSRIGQMVLDDGRWDGADIVPADWIAESWQARGRSPFSGDRYGYGWFLTTLGGAEAAYGRGYGGQMLAVVPEREIVIAITSDPSQPARSRGYFGDLRDLAERIVEEI